jgi:NAD(P)-dependent dehydrogenase (short-subunit alcohol dehydrogenase family)
MPGLLEKWLKLKGSILLLKGDVKKEAFCRRAVNEVIKNLKSINILVNKCRHAIASERSLSY